jgi:single-stranded DNA-binding protein
VNKIELVGTIASDIDARSEPDGTESAIASLHFHRGNGSVRLFSFGERARNLARFKSGDMVRICGRLTVNSMGKAAIIVDEVHHLDARQESAEDREAEEWNAARRHQGNAVVKGDNRFATRQRWQR